MTTTFTSEVLAANSPWLNPALQTYLSALAAMYEQVYGIVTDQGYPDDATYVPGWSVLLDPNNCPTQFLPYLSQFNGTVVPAGTDDATARAIIKAQAGQARGTGYYGPPTPGNPTGAGNGAMWLAAKANLTGTQFLIFRERISGNGSPDPYHAVIQFKPTECASVPALVAAVEAVKPAGIQVSYISAAGYTWSTATNTWSADQISWNASLSTQP